MPKTNEEGIEQLKEMLSREERDYAWVARKLNKTHQWVSRRMNGKTPMKLDDYRLIWEVLQSDSLHA